MEKRKKYCGAIITGKDVCYFDTSDFSDCCVGSITAREEDAFVGSFWCDRPINKSKLEAIAKLMKNG